MKYVTMNASIKWHPRSYYQYITQKPFTSQSSMKSLLCAFPRGYEYMYMHLWMTFSPSIYWEHLKAEDSRNHQKRITGQSTLSQSELCFSTYNRSSIKYTHWMRIFMSGLIRWRVDTWMQRHGAPSISWQNAVYSLMHFVDRKIQLLFIKRNVKSFCTQFQTNLFLCMKYLPFHAHNSERTFHFVVN